MADQYAIQDQNQFYALIAHSGTTNAAEVRRVTVDASNNLNTAVQSSALPTGAATSAKQDTLLTELQLKADLTETQPVTDAMSEISLGNYTGRFTVNKFGQAPDFDTGDLEVTMWDGANDGGIDVMQYVYSTTADIDRISSDSASDTFDVEIQGLDTNYDLVVQTITLTGVTPANLTTSLIRVFRMKNMGAANNVGRIFCFKNVATTGGVPNTAANVRAVMQIGINQTQMSIYTVPNGYTALLHRFYASTAGASRSAEYLLRLNARSFGGVFRLQQKGIVADGVAIDLDRHFSLPIAYGAKTDIAMTAQILTSNITGANIISGFDLELVAD